LVCVRIRKRMSLGGKIQKETYDKCTQKKGELKASKLVSSYSFQIFQINLPQCFKQSLRASS